MTKVVAFDIDGALTTDEGIRRYKEALKTDAKVGIVSARSVNNIMEFMLDNNIEADFVRSAQLKGMELRRIESRFQPDEMIYYGSWFRDRVHARLSGWEYRQI